MTPEEARTLFEVSLAARRRSVSLVNWSRSLNMHASALRHETALRRRRCFTISIRGAGQDGHGAAVRAKVAGGSLPRIAAAKTFYGHGEGKFCCACDLIVGRHEIEVEADFEGAIILRFHVECFRAWEEARQVA